MLKNISTPDASSVHVNPTAKYASIHLDSNALTITATSKSERGMELESFTHPRHAENVVAQALAFLHQAAKEHNLQYIAAAFHDDPHFNELHSRLWLQEDIVPFRIPPGQTITPGQSIEAMMEIFDEQDIVEPELTEDNEVIPSELVTLEDYKRITPPADFARLQMLARYLQGKKLIFINATPRGGGVALMRHALIRLLRLFDVDAHWYILKPSKEVFDITKTKIHNVLQAVASPETVLTPEDMEVYEEWTHENAEMLQDVLKQSHVVVIDDPQPAGLIPHIKRFNPEAKIIYRSHIQIVSSLANQPGTPQQITWNFLWDKIQLADYFVSHPMSMFIPDTVPAHKVFYMPATTDPLDGLNKPLSEDQLNNYMKIFNSYLQAAGQTPLDSARPFIVQVARFDPSKGIPDVLDSYRKLREMLEVEGRVVPQLIITGNGSIDDPDGVPIYNLIWNILQTAPYAHFAQDIKVLRLPHRDQILNALLRRSKVVLQLSTKEGFEVKVTEALMKGRPVIAYNVGGIPLQIEDGITGHLVEPNNTTQVAKHLYTLLTEDERYKLMSKDATERANTDYLTIPNALCWLFLTYQLLSGEPRDGNYQWVKHLAEKHIPLTPEQEQMPTIETQLV
ncbi:glycosyltransferase [Ktedonospora formicarum]|uniref:Glycosyl transferase family 1 domain-containing protein n=1 Tax=Ktedonospora formicarum TaxID=2778364 RepID=A0A8J3HX89_9CHLR|nr:glycosyltransferase [Ktedonospora formicarum]GHO42337.1 hypothetical protein KSX_05000 [Ktedonospora formicarum]